MGQDRITGDHVAANKTLSSTADNGHDTNSRGESADESHGRAYRGLKRRRVVRDDEDCDDDEPFPITPVGPGNQTTEVIPGPLAEAAKNEQPCPKHLVFLSVKVTGSTFMKFAVHEEITRQIPEYSHKLDKAATENPGAKRLRITDHMIGKEEVMTQAIEYLSDGTLEPLKGQDCSNTLIDLIYLCNLGVILRLGNLQRAIVDHIAECEGLAPETFVAFAAECYRDDKGRHQVTPDCLLGQFIKINLADHFDTLDESGAMDAIIDNGGTLGGQMAMVLRKKYRASQEAKKAEFKVEVEIED